MAEQIVFALINRGWRLVFTGLSFIIFGVGGLILGGIIFSLVHVIFPKPKAERLCRYGVHLAFKGFISFMYYTGVLSLELLNNTTLSKPGQFIIANHPSLIDVIFIIAEVPNGYCVVKSSAWKNPFIMLIMFATGYIQNNSPISFIDDCVEVLERGDTLLVFPEGTRSKPNQPLKFRKGAARIALKAKRSITPVHIYINPTTLTKDESWYHIPKNKFCFYMHVDSIINLQNVVQEDIPKQKHVKKLTQYLVNYFESKHHEFINEHTLSRD